MRVLKTRVFARFAKSESITDAQLAVAIMQAELGLIDADLGGGLIKLRIARSGKGKRGGFRTVIAYRAGSRAVFLTGFAKSRRDNIEPFELAALKLAAADLLSVTDKAVNIFVDGQRLIEVYYDG